MKILMIIFLFFQYLFLALEIFYIYKLFRTGSDETFSPDEKETNRNKYMFNMFIMFLFSIMFATLYQTVRFLSEMPQ